MANTADLNHNFENIPAGMREMPRWLLWKLETRKDGNGKERPTKVPYSIHGGPGKTNTPETWGSYAEALTAYQNGGYSGIGFVFTGTPFVAVDIDGCYNPETKTMTDQALDIVGRLKSYTEYSQSGKGLHIITRGKLPEGRRRSGSVEMYGDGSPRYFAMTGNCPGNAPLPIRECQTVIDTVHAKHIADKPAQDGAERHTPLSAGDTASGGLLSDDALLEKARAAKNGPAFAELFDQGDLSAYADDRSRADLALCAMLAFWCRKDRTDIDRLFRRSALMRKKWDEKHGGDTYGNITVEKAISGYGSVYGPREKSPAVRQSFEQAPAEQWEPPIPFETLDTPDFPTGSLPHSVANFVEALAESTQTPEEMAGVLALGILSTAFQSRYTVEITPDWTEPLCLYPVAIALPGERKSSVIEALARPVYEYEAERREFEAAAVAQNQLEKRMLEEALANAENAATRPQTTGKRKGNTTEQDGAIKDPQAQARQTALDLAEQLSAFKEMHPFRLLADDTTPEKLTDIMDKHGGCITVSSAEGGVFDSLAGRYDRSTNFDIYLKGHAGDSITVDRIGRKSNYIRHPRLTMMLTIQPEVLAGLMGNATFKGRGLCGRFLYAMCKSKVGNRNADPEPVPPQVKEDYRQFVRRILSGQDTGKIRLSTEAHQLRLEYAAQVERRLGGDLEHMRDWGGKLVGTMLRIAALIHTAEAQGSPADTPVSGEIITAAVNIAEFLCAHAMAAYQVMGADKDHGDAKYLWKRIESTGQDEISKRDLFNICKGKFKKVDEMEPALQTLAEMGYIREIDNQTGERGRPSKKIIVNPLSKNSKNSKISGNGYV